MGLFLSREHLEIQLPLTPGSRKFPRVGMFHAGREREKRKLCGVKTLKAFVRVARSPATGQGNGNTNGFAFTPFPQQLCNR